MLVFGHNKEDSPEPDIVHFSNLAHDFYPPSLPPLKSSSQATVYLVCCTRLFTWHALILFLHLYLVRVLYLFPFFITYF